MGRIEGAPGLVPWRGKGRSGTEGRVCAWCLGSAPLSRSARRLPCLLSWLLASHLCSPVSCVCISLLSWAREGDRVEKGPEGEGAWTAMKQRPVPNMHASCKHTYCNTQHAVSGAGTAGGAFVRVRLCASVLVHGCVRRCSSGRAEHIRPEYVQRCAYAMGVHDRDR